MEDRDEYGRVGGGMLPLVRYGWVFLPVSDVRLGEMMTHMP